MSDTWIILVPKEAGFVPPAQSQESALIRLRELMPDAGEIKIKVADKIRFEHCGGLFESIKCPVCSKEIAVEQWQEWMDVDFGEDHNFKLKPIKLPCCGESKALHDLAYWPPQGFARFSLEAMNPNIGELSKQSLAAVEEILGCSLRVVYRRI